MGILTVSHNLLELGDLICELPDHNVGRGPEEEFAMLGNIVLGSVCVMPLPPEHVIAFLVPQSIIMKGELLVPDLQLHACSDSYVIMCVCKLTHGYVYLFVILRVEIVRSSYHVHALHLDSFTIIT